MILSIGPGPCCSGVSLAVRASSSWPPVAASPTTRPSDADPTDLLQRVLQRDDDRPRRSPTDLAEVGTPAGLGQRTERQRLRAVGRGPQQDEGDKPNAEVSTVQIPADDHDAGEAFGAYVRDTGCTAAADPPPRHAPITAEPARRAPAEPRPDRLRPSPASRRLLGRAQGRRRRRRTPTPGSPRRRRARSSAPRRPTRSSRTAGRAGRSPTLCRSTRASAQLGHQRRAPGAGCRRRPRGDGVRLHSPSAAVPPTTISCSRGTTYVGPARSSSHQRSRPTCSTHHDLSGDRHHRPVGPEQPRAEARAVHHDVAAAVGQRAEVEPGQRCRRAPRPGAASQAR